MASSQDLVHIPFLVRKQQPLNQHGKDSYATVVNIVC